jgi:hypothetical protein
MFTVSENFTLGCDIQKRSNFDFIKNILILLLQHGLDCKITPAEQHKLQSVVDMMMNVRTCPDILCVYELLLVLIQYGSDPNVTLGNRISSLSGSSNTSINYVNDFMNFGVLGGAPASASGNSDSLRNSFRNNARNYLLFYYIMLITRKEFILLDPNQTYQRIIYLFYYSMKHETLYNCLKSLHNLFIAQVPHKSIDNLRHLIITLYKKPRSLKQLCRVHIYNSLDKKLAQNLNRLNLPLPLKEYVLNFE